MLENLVLYCLKIQPILCNKCLGNNLYRKIIFQSKILLTLVFRQIRVYLNKALVKLIYNIKIKKA